MSYSKQYASNPPNTTTPALLSALLSLRSTPPRIIQSPPTQPRRASVALIIRLRPPEGLVVDESQNGVGLGLEEFFRLPWVSHPDTIPQLLFIRRSTRPSDRFSSHIAFPGGRQEPSDDSSHYTALRETWEEIGLDLAEKEYVSVGRLDDREITTSLGKRLLMILSPFVFLQTTPYSPEPDLQPSEVCSLHWIPIPSLVPPFPRSQWTSVEIDISSRLSPRNKLVRLILRGLVGNMKFGAVLLPDEPDAIAEGWVPEFAERDDGGDDYGSSGTIGGGSGNKPRQLRLWGLTLGMTLDLLAHLPQADATPLVRPASGLPASGGSGFTIASPAIGPRGLLDPKTPVTVTSSFDDHWLHSTGATTTAVANGQSNGDPALRRRDLNGKSQQTRNGRGGGSRDDASGGGGGGFETQIKRRGVGPGVTAVFPRFSYPDVNFWIWVFGRRYRTVVRGWQASVTGPARSADRRTNWSGAALSAFYSAVRQALLVAILIRALTTAVGLSGIAYWIYKRWYAV